MEGTDLHEQASVLLDAIDRLRVTKEPEARGQDLAKVSWLALGILDRAQELAAQTPKDDAGPRYSMDGLSCLSNGVIHEADGEVFPIVTTFGLADEDAQAEALMTAVDEALARRQSPQ